MSAQAFLIALSLLCGSVSHCSFLSAASMCRIHTCLFEHQRSLCIRRAVMAGKCCVIIGIRLILALYRMLGRGRMLSSCYRRLFFCSAQCFVTELRMGQRSFQVSEAAGCNSAPSALVFISLYVLNLSPCRKCVYFCIPHDSHQHYTLYQHFIYNLFLELHLLYWIMHICSNVS